MKQTSVNLNLMILGVKNCLTGCARNNRILSSNKVEFGYSGLPARGIGQKLLCISLSNPCSFLLTDVEQQLLGDRPKVGRDGGGVRVCL